MLSALSKLVRQYTAQTIYFGSFIPVNDYFNSYSDKDTCTLNYNDHLIS
jgi:putative salt-induced outer membrane protein YdiY